MKIANILFNYKKSSSVNKVLGVERCFVDYAKYLSESGNEVISITKPNMIFSAEVKGTKSQFAEISAVNQIDIFSILRLAFLFIRFKPDVAVCHSGRAVFFARAARIFCLKKYSIVAVDHGINPKKFLKADYVLTVNSYFNKELIKAGKSPDTAFVIPNMMEVPQGFVPLVKQPFRKPVRFGSLGRLYPEKNFDKVLLAMKILRDRGIESEYVIGGVGPVEGTLNDLAVHLGLEKNFKILGWTDKKREFFDSIDIFILPSKYETFGIVLLEAMLYSTPIITSNTWGPDEVITHEVDGLKVSRDDDEKVPELIANAVERLIKDESFAKKIAENSYEKFKKNFAAEVVVKKLNEIFQRVCRQG